MIDRVARRVSSPHTVGRTDTLAALDGALTQVSEGAAQLVLLAGEAGIGKTRMAHELADRARERGQRVLWGECVPMQAGELPYAPLVAALRGRGAETGVALDRLLTELRDGRGGGAPATPQAPARLFELLLGALGRLAETTPTVVVVEDIHWADHATQDLVRFLARNLRDERLLILATLRTDEPAPPGLRDLLAELARSARVERLELTRLTAEDTALQVAGIVGADGDAALAEWVHGRAEGNPYFAEELLAARVAGEPGAALPDSLRDVLLTRMAGLDGAPRQVVLIAATAGRDIGHELLARAAGLDAEVLAAALRELVAAHVLVCDASAERYRFRHALAGEAVYAELLPPERRALHAAIARALEAAVPAPDRGAAEWAALAQHWDGAHDEAAALRSSVAAAAAAHEVYAFEAARGHLERARALWERVAPAARPRTSTRSSCCGGSPTPRASRATARPPSRSPRLRSRSWTPARSPARRLDPHPARGAAPLARTRPAAARARARAAAARPVARAGRSHVLDRQAPHLRRAAQRDARVRARGARCRARGRRAGRGGASSTRRSASPSPTAATPRPGSRTTARRSASLARSVAATDWPPRSTPSATRC